LKQVGPPPAHFRLVSDNQLLLSEKETGILEFDIHPFLPYQSQDGFHFGCFHESMMCDYTFATAKPIFDKDILRRLATPVILKLLFFNHLRQRFDAGRSGIMKSDICCPYGKRRFSAVSKSL
jgi:hypothetical protein